MKSNYINKALVVIIFFITTMSSYAQIRNEKIINDNVTKNDKKIDIKVMRTNMDIMNAKIKSIMHHTSLDEGQKKDSKEMITYMENINEICKYMNSMLEQMEKMNVNRSVMQDKKNNENFKSIMKDMDSMMNNYKTMINDVGNKNKEK